MRVEKREKKKIYIYIYIEREREREREADDICYHYETSHQREPNYCDCKVKESITINITKENS